MFVQALEIFGNPVSGLVKNAIKTCNATLEFSRDTGEDLGKVKLIKVIRQRVFLGFRKTILD